MEKTNNLTAIDLFCGCGGFSLGMDKAGINILAAIDFNKEAIQVYRENFNDKTSILCRDLTRFLPEHLAVIIKTNKVDVIFGGPPCQGFSNLRKRDGANHGPKLIDDKRRHLYEQFLRYVQYFQPSIFVMENVLGIRTAACGEYYKNVQSDARKMDYRVYGITINANDFGVPQKRRRQLIIGTRYDLPVYFNKTRHLDDFKIKDRDIKLGMAISDLPHLNAGEGQETMDYDLLLREKCIAQYGSWYLNNVLDIKNSQKLTSHVARLHSKRDIEDFKLLNEGENCNHAINRGVKFLCPYNRTYFKDRYTRQSREGLCSTIVAHMSKDGLMFIHPEQDRSLTPREAARIQSFPDTFQFPVTRTNQYRLIGNAVPPLIGEAIGKALQKYLEDVNQTYKNCCDIDFSDLSLNPMEAADGLWKFVEIFENKGTLKSISPELFKRGWLSIGYLYPRLHPDGIIDCNSFGKSYDDCLDIDSEVKSKYPKLSRPYYVQSGCPVVLEPIIKEANRRYNNNELTEAEFYCSSTLLAGLNYRLKINDSNSDDTNLKSNNCESFNDTYSNHYSVNIEGELS